MKVGRDRYRLDEMVVGSPWYKLSPSRSLSRRRHQPKLFLLGLIESLKYERHVINILASPSPFYKRE